MLPTNPLTQYFRQPAIYIRLPSQGKFYPPGTLNMPPNGELPVLPMTSVDEITYRTPDALFNGSATASVIQSCIPAIRDPWAMPSIDMDAVLVAIRIASYGHGMEVSTTCPACEEQEDVTVDLRRVNDSLSVGNYDEPLKIGDLEIYFRPITFKSVNTNNQIQMEQQQVVRSLESITDAERSEKVEALMTAINEATLATVAGSVAVIRSPNALVTEYDFILDYLKNSDSKSFNLIKERAIELKKQSEVKPINITCTSCKHEYTQPFTLDLSSFFDNAS
jgi:T4 bacteriophage base plate protein